jgi:hypothetical protein
MTDAPLSGGIDTLGSGKNAGPFESQAISPASDDLLAKTRLVESRHELLSPSRRETRRSATRRTYHREPAGRYENIAKDYLSHEHGMPLCSGASYVQRRFFS